MTLVAIWRIGLGYWLFPAKMVMRSVKTRTTPNLAAESFSLRALMAGQDQSSP